MEMEFSFNKIGGANGVRKQVVQGPAEVVERDPVGEGEGGGLCQGMDAGVGAAGTGDLDGRALDFGQRGFQSALNGSQAGLHLPAVEVRAIIGDVRADAARWTDVHAKSALRAVARRESLTIPLKIQGTIAPICLV